MNSQHSLSLSIGILTVLMVGCAATVSPIESEATPKPTAANAPITPSATPKTTTTAENAGSPFMGVPNSGHTQISGNARTIVEGNQHYVVLDKTFNTENGPDLTVVLVRSSELKSPELAEGSYLLLDELQANQGEQRYTIPSGVNLEEFGAVAIWCRQFNTTFGYAKL